MNISPLGNSGVATVTVIVLLGTAITCTVDRQAGAKIRRLNQELERRVTERTQQLESANQSLRQEIAEHEVAREALRQSEDRLQRLIDTTPAMLYSASPDGTMEFFNKRWLEYLGLPLEQLTGWGWIAAVHPDDLDSVQSKWRSTLATGAPFEHEMRVRRADGQYRWFLIRKEPARDAQGHIVKWYGSGIDIEDSKRAESALQEAQQKLALVTRVQAMAELAAAIAHEVNQPLTAIVTNGNFCLRQLAGGAPNLEELHATIKEIVDDGTRASEVLSRIRGMLVKRFPLRQPVDLNGIIQDAIILLRGELTQCRIQLRSDLAPDAPRVHGDPVQLQQVLINLLMNAVEAIRASSQGKREILIRSAKSVEGVVVQVHDSGPGIEAGLDKRIFEPFFTTKAEGTGLGLAISRSIVESHGGHLSFVKTSPGALFQFTLPLSPNGDP